MITNVRKSVGIVAKEHGISRELMCWLLKTQGRMEWQLRRFRASEEYKQYEHVFMNNYCYYYDSEFYEGIDYSENAIQRALVEWEAFLIQQTRYLQQ